MSTIDFDLLIDSRVAAFNGQHPELSRVATAQSLASLPVEDGGFSFSGDHLGTFSHRETTEYGDPGAEIRRERIHTANVNVWDMVAA